MASSFSTLMQKQQKDLWNNLDSDIEIENKLCAELEESFLDFEWESFQGYQLHYIETSHKQLLFWDEHKDLNFNVCELAKGEFHLVLKELFVWASEIIGRIEKESMNDMILKQKEICKKYNTEFKPTDLNLKVGISKSVKGTKEVIHGLRVKEENGTSGWYFWSGDWSDDSEFFVPLHGKHLHEWAEIIVPFLGLPEGYRFLISDDYVDVWKDENIFL